jgi:spore coat protein A
MLSRRDFLKLGAITTAGLSFPAAWLSRPPDVKAYSQSRPLQKFIQRLRRPGDDIPLAQKDLVNPGWWQPGVDHYTIDIGQYEDQLHPDLEHPTRLWGFGQGTNFKHLGGIIAAKRDTPVQITFRNNLPSSHIIPVDDTIMGVAGNQNNRANIHLHGGLVPWISDGGPHAWWDPDGHKGSTFLNNQVLRPGQTVPANEAEYYYPNNQGSRLAWYHDHTFGNTRINAYAGVASAYVIYDDYELALVAANNLPGPLDARTLYLVFQDKVFVRSDIANLDPAWPTLMTGSRAGDLWYAHDYDPTRWTLNTGGVTPTPSIIPEFFGDTILVNGTAYPFVEVEQRQYRLRMLNACNARFLNPRLVYAKGTAFPANSEPSNGFGPSFIQIGSEGGFLPQPVMINAPSQTELLLSPAERADLIVDFRDVPDGSILLLYNDAPAPYPMGDDLDDFYPGNSDFAGAQPGYGPNTRTLLQVRVKARVGAADAPITLPKKLTPTDPFLVNQEAGRPTPIPPGVQIRRLSLNEDFDMNGRLIQYLGTDVPTNSNAAGLLFGREYMGDATEVIHAGTTEVWDIMNLTGDTHPIHFHLVNVQILARIPFDVANYTGSEPEMGDAYAPEPNEHGWKETVRINPGEITRVIMRFNLAVVPFTVPASPRTGGHEYVWHCHILEHEEHDMMRPLVIKDTNLFLPIV